MTSLRCTRALLLWCAFVGLVAWFLLRYDLLPSAEGMEGYLPSLYERTRASFYYQSMIVFFLGCIAYCISLIATLGKWQRYSDVDASAWSARLVGLGSTGPDSRDWNLVGPVVIILAANPIRDAAILFPAVGFIGTVVGVSLAIGGLNEVIDSGETAPLLDGLRIAFDTTLIGLVASVVLTALLYVVQVRATVLKAQMGRE